MIIGINKLDILKIMKIKLFVLLVGILACCSNLRAQDLNDLFVTYTPVYTPPQPVYSVPMPSIYDNSITIINNSYSSPSSRISCIDTQIQNGQILLIDLTDQSELVVNAEVKFMTYSNKSVSIQINRIQLDKQWHTVNVSVSKLSSLLDKPNIDRKPILSLLDFATFYGYSENVLFIF